MENQSSEMHFLLLEEVQFLKVNDDSLLQWELVDVVDAEEDFDAFESSNSSDSCPNHAPIEEIRHLLLRESLHDHEIDSESQGESGLEVRHYDYHQRHFPLRDVDDGDDDEDDDEDDDGYGLDDELVPWTVSNKFGRQRMRKLGKRVFSKMHSSKKSPYLFVRPGCVRGKHGLGLKHVTDS
ncbi:hypothetical protein PHAVU_011G041100 [Phaseolus vulgaris]|uniref:Uncharacterized protein n=1 Tax=Phaseolus vulgaris TaxID=3885 RepID=V7AI62_PHAVU|nr:hypothetical protein PHAVU_011G041100g [Phaseolus vulgaris]ESW03776.1 hypothetical protein PHAVU_011G041100g [Phaseolus vulgaris]